MDSSKVADLYINTQLPLVLTSEPHYAEAEAPALWLAQLRMFMITLTRHLQCTWIMDTARP